MKIKVKLIIDITYETTSSESDPDDIDTVLDVSMNSSTQDSLFHVPGFILRDWGYDLQTK